MAGIIVDVSSDIQKLQKLKAEIASVKQEVKGIDIRVRLDIKESIETRLKALSEQYTALVMKIAEAEGKIKLSVHNINKASEAIIQAQEKMSKATGVTTQQPSATVTPSNISAETASIQAQAKAYEDLRTEINAVLGTREANIKRMLDEKKAIDLINAEIKKITKSQGDYGNLSSSQQKRLEQLNNSLLTHKAALAEVRQVLGNNVKMDNAAATSMDALGQSLSRMRITYRGLTEEERKSPFGKELLASINQADAKIKELDASIGNHARNVGNYKKEWNGLQNQMQIVARELPNFAISPQIGIMSLTNNIPYLADELKKAKDAHREYVTAVKVGQKDLEKVPSVGKQVLSSLFSWQTGLIMVITLITAYRKEITEWCKGLSNAKNELNAASEAQFRLNDAIRQGSKDSIKERTQLDLLYNKLKDTTISTKERNSAINEWIKLNPQYSSVISGEKININQLGIAYKELTKRIIASAQAKRIEALLISGVEKQADLIGNVTNAIIAKDEAQKKVNRSQSEYNKIKSKENKEILEIDKKSLNRREKELIESQNSLRKQTLINESVKKNLKLDNLFPQPKEGTFDYWTQQKNIAETTLKSIASTQKELMDTGKFEGIPQEVIDQYKQAVKLKAEADKALKVYDDPTKQDNQSEKLREQQEKYNLLLDKQKREQERMKTDSLHELEQIEINALQEGSEKILRQRALNHQKELEAIKREAAEKQLRVIEEARSAFEANPDKNKGAFDADKFVKSEPAKKQFAVFDKVAESKVKTEEIKYNRGDDLNNLINEYQDFSDRRLAIENKFNEDIKVLDAQRKTALEKGDMGQVDKIDRSKVEAEKKKKEDLSSVSMDEFKADIDWATLFGNLNVLSPDMLNKLRDKLKAFIESAAGKLTPEDLKTLSEAMTNVDLTIADKTPYEALKTGLSGYKTATDEASVAQDKLNKLQKDGKEGTKEYKDATKELTDAQRRRAESLKTVTQAANNIGSKGMEVVNAGNQIVGMLENFGVKVPEAVGATLDGIGQVMSGLESIDLTKPFSAVTGAITILTGVGNTIAGLFGFGGADYSGYDKMKSQYENLISIWDELIDKKMEYIDIDYGKEALKAAKEAEAAINLQISRQRQLIKQLASSGASAGSHSLGYRIDHRLSKEDYERLSDLTGEKITAEYQLWDLSSEQIEKILTDEKLVSVLDTVNRDFVGYLQNIADYGDKLDEVSEKEKAAVSGMGFDEFKDGYTDMLSDLDSTNEDFANNFEKYLQKSIFQSLIANEYKGQIQNLYASWAKVGKDGLTPDEAAELRKKQEYLTNSMLAERDKLMNDFGWESDSSREASQKGIATASQESVDENNGRLTMIQGHTYSLNENVGHIANGINSIAGHTANLSCLTNIDSTMKSLITMREEANTHLANIDNHTANLVNMREDMHSMKQDINTMLIKGLKLSKN